MLITTIPCLADNYAYIIHDPKSNQTAVIDPGEAYPISRILRDKNWDLNFILNTHHHSDHNAGNDELKNLFKNSKIVAKDCNINKDKSNIDLFLNDGTIIQFGAYKIKTIFTPGHTKKLLFVFTLN